MLARVDAIKNASRIEALHQREIDDTKLRDNHYRLHVILFAVYHCSCLIFSIIGNSWIQTLRHNYPDNLFK